MDWTPGDPVELRAGRFLLRSMRPQDVTQRYVNWFGDPKVMGGMNTPLAAITLDVARQRIARRYDNATRFECGIFDRQRGDLLIGFIDLTYMIHNRVAAMTTIIGDRDYWGKNILLAVAETWMEFVFETLGAEKITAEAASRNLPIIFVGKAMGMTVEAVLRKEWRMAGRGRADVLLFGLLREDWRAGRSVKKHEG